MEFRCSKTNPQDHLPITAGKRSPHRERSLKILLPSADRAPLILQKDRPFPPNSAHPGMIISAGRRATFPAGRSSHFVNRLVGMAY
jgi:hypothetical protein